MAELLNHQHCRVCDRAVPVGDATCPEHAAEYAALQKKRRRTVILFYVAGGVMVFVLGRQLLANLLP